MDGYYDLYDQEQVQQQDHSIPYDIMSYPGEFAPQTANDQHPHHLSPTPTPSHSRSPPSAPVHHTHPDDRQEHNFDNSSLDPSLTAPHDNHLSPNDAVAQGGPGAYPVPTVELGRTRCYWCILTPSLEFAFLDPILHTHLESESSKFIGSNLLDYVHPEEVERLRADLVADNNAAGAGGVESGGVFGSVTRCRYSRLSRIRRLLGCESPYIPPNASQYVYDSDYIELQITTSWIGGPSTKERARGAVLAFFHATEDINTIDDNNEERRNAWSNWCGPHLKDGPYLDPRRCRQLEDALVRSTGPHSPALASTYEEDDLRERAPPPHVFQILDHTGQAIVTFPAGNNGTKSYDSNEFAALAKDVVARPRGPSDATTSCMRRYRSKHPIYKDGDLITIESVVILYGAVTFACFQTGVHYASSRSRGSASTSPRVANIGPNNFQLEDVPPATSPSGGRKREHLPEEGVYEDEYEGHPAEGTSDFPLIKRQRKKRTSDTPPVPSPSSSAPSLSLVTSSQALQQKHYTPKLDVDVSTTGGDLSPTVASASAILGSFSANGAHHDLHRSYDYGRNPNISPYHHGHHVQHPPYSPHPLHQTQYPYHEPEPQHHHHHQQHAPPMGLGLQTHSYDSPAHRQSVHEDSPAPPPVAATTSNNIDRANGSERPPKVPRIKGDPVNKVGPKACESCGTMNSPEWRKGPGGVKSLCNACGLRYARSLARKNKIENGESPTPKKGKAALAAAQSNAAQALAASQGSPSQTRPASPSPTPTSSSLSSSLQQHGDHYDIQPSYKNPAPLGPARPYSPYYGGSDSIPSPTMPSHSAAQAQQSYTSSAPYSLAMSQTSYQSPAYVNSPTFGGPGGGPSDSPGSGGQQGWFPGALHQPSPHPQHGQPHPHEQQHDHGREHGRHSNGGQQSPWMETWRS
ncbi:hypothetical protein T439DRAFT_354408 [Meredithblackwellia eburnea MCA 4105]